MTITVLIKNVYGNQTVYPVCEKAKLFAAIANQKTLTVETIARIKMLGYDITVQHPTLTL